MELPKKEKKAYYDMYYFESEGRKLRYETDEDCNSCLFSLDSDDPNVLEMVYRVLISRCEF